MVWTLRTPTPRRLNYAALASRSMPPVRFITSRQGMRCWLVTAWLTSARHPVPLVPACCSRAYACSRNTYKVSDHPFLPLTVGKQNSFPTLLLRFFHDCAQIYTSWPYLHNHGLHSRTRYSGRGDVYFTPEDPQRLDSWLWFHAIVFQDLAQT